MQSAGSCRPCMGSLGCERRTTFTRGNRGFVDAVGRREARDQPGEFLDLGHVPTSMAAAENTTRLPGLSYKEATGLCHGRAAALEDQAMIAADRSTAPCLLRCIVPAYRQRCRPTDPRAHRPWRPEPVATDIFLPKAALSAPPNNLNEKEIIMPFSQVFQSLGAIASIIVPAKPSVRPLEIDLELPEPLTKAELAVLGRWVSEDGAIRLDLRAQWPLRQAARPGAGPWRPLRGRCVAALFRERRRPCLERRTAPRPARLRREAFPPDPAAGSGQTDTV
jgi:hypothetical protein